jgi:hypothetical protein
MAARLRDLGIPAVDAATTPIAVLRFVTTGGA